MDCVINVEFYITTHNEKVGCSDVMCVQKTFICLLFILTVLLPHFFLRMFVLNVSLEQQHL
jgi:hypothetical protein